MTFLNWHPGEPNDANNVENCAEMYPADTRWNDIMCTDLNGYICKQPLGKVYRLNTKSMDREGLTLSSHQCELSVFHSVLSIIEISRSANKRGKFNP